MAVRSAGEAAGSWPAVRATALAWAGLGLAMFLVRWLDASGSSSFCIGGGCAASTTTHPVLVALFFGAIYAVSGACTIVEDEQLHNTVYFAYRRLGRMLWRQAQVVINPHRIRAGCVAPGRSMAVRSPVGPPARPGGERYGH